MPAPNVDMSAHGKIHFDIFPNVVTKNQKPVVTSDLAGFIKLTSDNQDKINAARGRIRNMLQVDTFTAASSVIRQSSNGAIADLKEQAKGVYLDTVG